MKITFLGTSHGVPAADRWCSASLIEAGDGLYLIDAGGPVIDLLLRAGVDLRRVKALFTTHMHGDHVNGVLAFADLINWYFKEAQADIYLTEPRGIALFTELIEQMESEKLDAARVRFRLMTPELVYQDENLRLTPVPTRHLAALGRPSYAYLVEAEGRSVLFTGDLSGGLREKDFPAPALERDLDAVICEMAHFDVPDVLPWLERCRAGQVLFNHVWPLDKLARIAALDGRFGIPVRPVDDGDVLELPARTAP